MRQPVAYYQETVEGVRDVLALFPLERQRHEGVWYTLAYGRLWHLAGVVYGERRLDDAQIAALTKVKIAHVADSAPAVVEAGAAYLRAHLRGER